MPKNSERIHFPVRVSVTGQNNKVYEGIFEFYRRTVGDIPAIAAQTARMCEGQEPVGSFGNLVQMMAELAVMTHASPTWWRPDTLVDETVVVHVYRAYADWRDAFFRPAPAEPSSDSVAQAGTSEETLP